MSEVLDDERKEAFLLALHGLKEEKEDAEQREEKLRQQQREQMEERRRESEQKRMEMARIEEDRRKQEEARKQTERVSDRIPGAIGGNGQDEGRDERKLRQPKPTSRRTPAKKPSTPPPGLYSRVGGLFAAIQKAIADSAKQMTSNPLAFLRMLLFLIAFSIAFGKRDLRERIMRLVRQAVDKIRRTVGMGVKVSYI